MAVDVCKRISVRLHVHATLLATTKCFLLIATIFFTIKILKLVRGGWFSFLWFCRPPLPLTASEGDGVEAICAITVHHL